MSGTGRRPALRCGLALVVLALLAVLGLPACTDGPRAPAGAASAGPAGSMDAGTFVASTGTFACEAPRHVCPTRFDPDLRQKACTCQGEPGRFRYHREGR